jgi:pimeloyl-ACP methyl ester carboxylesterase
MLRVVGPPLAATASMWSAAASAAPGGRASQLAPLLDTINSFARHDWTWFSRLVVEASRQSALDTAAVPFPVTVVAGHIDAFVDTERLRAVAATMPDARFVALPGSHFVPVQQPDAVHAELLDLITRADLAP